jgi:hypothetical protein
MPTLALDAEEVGISVGFAMGYGTDELDSIPGKGKMLFHSVKTGCGVHPHSYPVGTGGSFLWGSRGRGVKLSNHLLHVMVINNLQTGSTFYSLDGGPGEGGLPVPTGNKNPCPCMRGRWPAVASLDAVEEKEISPLLSLGP